jgi:Protein of unknown function (DUF1344)
MRKLLMALTAFAGMAGIGGIAHADSMPLPGVVKSVDPTRHVVVLEDGRRFYAASDVQVDGLRPGTRLLLYTRTINGRKTIVSYEFVHQ